MCMPQRQAACVRQAVPCSPCGGLPDHRLMGMQALALPRTPGSAAVCACLQGHTADVCWCLAASCPRSRAASAGMDAGPDARLLGGRRTWPRSVGGGRRRTKRSARGRRPIGGFAGSSAKLPSGKKPSAGGLPGVLTCPRTDRPAWLLGSRQSECSKVASKLHAGFGCVVGNTALACCLT